MDHLCQLASESVHSFSKYRITDELTKGQVDMPCLPVWPGGGVYVARRLLSIIGMFFQMLVLTFGTVYHLRSGLWTWRSIVSDEVLTPICLHWCDEISAPNDYWFLALYEFSLCMLYTYVTCKSMINTEFLARSLSTTLFQNITYIGSFIWDKQRTAGVDVIYFAPCNHMYPVLRYRPSGRCRQVALLLHRGPATLCVPQ